jgi:hypothetical protein
MAGNINKSSMKKLRMCAIMIIITHGVVISDQRQEAALSSVLFKYNNGVVVNASVNKLGYLGELSVKNDKSIVKIDAKYLTDIAAPEIGAITLTPILKDGRLLGHEVAISFNRRFYKWGESTSKVIFFIDDERLHSKLLNKPIAKGESETLEVYNSGIKSQ